MRSRTLSCVVLSAMIMFPAAVKSETPLELQMLCQKGNAQSCNELGVQYLWGTGVPESEEMAFNLFEAACKKGLAEGCTRFARLVEYGEGDEEENFTKALGLYARGCAGQYAPGCADLAATFELEPLNDLQSALHFFKLACDLGASYACEEASRIAATGTAD